MIVKKLVIGFFSVLSMSINITSFAALHDLFLTNNTKSYSTSKINNGECSSSIPNGLGVIPPDGQRHKIPGLIVAGACSKNPSDCTAEVFMTNNCNKTDHNAKSIAIVVFDTQHGIKSKQIFDSSYDIVGEGFDIILNGGPTVIARE